MAGIRKKLKAIKKRLSRLVSKTPKRKFYYGFFSKYCRLRPKWVLIESFHQACYSGIVKMHPL